MSHVIAMGRRSSWLLFRLGVLTLAARLATAEQRAERPTPTELTSEVVAALRRGGLPEAARVVHHYVGLVEFEDGEAVVPDLEHLCDLSDVIDVAVVRGRAPSVLGDGQRSIWTGYSAGVVESIKGRHSTDQLIEIRMPGGFVQFKNGTTAQMIGARGRKELQLGRSYVLFLNRDRTARNVYIPQSGAQGVFAIEGARVVSRARETDDVFEKYNNMYTTEFLSLARAAACSRSMFE